MILSADGRAARAPGVIPCRRCTNGTCRGWNGRDRGAVSRGRGFRQSRRAVISSSCSTAFRRISSGSMRISRASLTVLSISWTRWSARMLRIGCYELLFRHDVPYRVGINEAIISPRSSAPSRGQVRQRRAGQGGSAPASGGTRQVTAPRRRPGRRPDAMAFLRVSTAFARLESGRNRIGANCAGNDRSGRSERPTT